MAIHMTIPKDDFDLKPKITVIGVGGAGGNAVNNMIRSNLQGVEFVVANADAQALAQSECQNRVQLGTNITRGLGAGSRPEIGKAAAEEAIDELIEYLHGSNMVFITAGMGGGTGTGAGPVIARIAREKGILTVGVVTKPFHFEGAHRMRLAEAGLDSLQQVVDTLIVIPNQNLFRLANENTTFADAFKMADDVLHSGVRGITDLMVMPGLVNLDFADIRTVMMEMGKAMMGTGEADGAGRAITAAEAAISNPLLDDVSMKGARGVLINITGSKDMTLFEIDEAANRIREEVDADANIIFGSTFDDNLKDKIRISIVATGIDALPKAQKSNFDAQRNQQMQSPQQQPVMQQQSAPQYVNNYAVPQQQTQYAQQPQHGGNQYQQQNQYNQPQQYQPNNMFDDTAGVFIAPPPVRADIRPEVIPPRPPVAVVDPVPVQSTVVAEKTTPMERSEQTEKSEHVDTHNTDGNTRTSLFGRLAQTVSGKAHKSEHGHVEATEKREINTSSSPAIDDDELEIPAFLRRK